MHREIISPALVLRTRSYGESDRIVTLLTEHHGKVSGIAKGAKNSRRRFAGTLEPFVRIRAAFRQRPTSDLVFLLRCELVGVWRSFGRDLDCFVAGTAVLELTDRMVLGREPGGELYRLVEATLALLDRGAPCELVLRGFELRLLEATGYAPVLDRCRGCGRPLGVDVTAYLGFERGGLACRACIRAGEPVRPVSAAALAELQRLAVGSLEAAASGTGGVAAGEVAAVAEHLLAAVTPGPLRARTFAARLRDGI